jgi:hypothetical protein
MSTTEEFPTEMSELDAFLASLHGTDEVQTEEEETSTGATEEGSETGAAGEEETEATPTASVSLAPPGTIEFNGRFIPVDEVEQLLAFSERLKTEPDFANRVREAAVPKTTTELPPHVDPEDAFQVATWHDLQAAKAETARLQAEQRTASERDQRARVVDSFRNAVSTFKAKYPGLTDDQVRQIADATGRANIIEGLERTEGSLTAAFDRGMEMTMWGTPELRSLAQVANADNVSTKKSSDRKSKQSALSGSGGSAPRTKPAAGRPKNRQELMDAMLADVRASVTD